MLIQTCANTLRSTRKLRPWSVSSALLDWFALGVHVITPSIGVRETTPLHCGLNVHLCWKLEIAISDRYTRTYPGSK